MAGAQNNVNGTAAPRTDEGEELAALRLDFPGFRIWHEEICDRRRYAARSQLPGLHPHTVTPRHVRPAAVRWRARRGDEGHEARRRTRSGCLLLDAKLVVGPDSGQPREGSHGPVALKAVMKIIEIGARDPAAHVSAAASRFRGCHRMIRKPCLMADGIDESKRMRDLVSALHGSVSAGYGCDRRMAQRSSLMRIRLPAGSRKAQSRIPYGCMLGSWTTSAPGTRP